MMLDHVERWELPAGLAQERGNELRCLSYLWPGLELLFETVDKVEQEVRGRAGPQRRVTWPGEPPKGFEWVPQDQLCCCFHWYAVSAYNYALVVGKLAQEAGLSTEKPKDYASRVMPEVALWRNKVAAHVAWAAPRPEDSLADLVASTMHPLSFCEDRFYAAKFGIQMRVSGQDQEDRLRPWSLTKEYLALYSRYWLHSQ